MNLISNIFYVTKPLAESLDLNIKPLILGKSVVIFHLVGKLESIKIH